MEIKNVRGLRYPDEYVIKCFFKFALDKKPGKVIEFGCGNGNNLLLFQEFGWSVTGIDYDESELAKAEYNLGDAPNVNLIQADLASSVPIDDLIKFEAILLPNINYYLPKAKFTKLLSKCNEIVSQNTLFFIRCRTLNDWRYGKGKKVEKNGFVLEAKETGEADLLNVFYDPDELEEIINSFLPGITGLQKLLVNYENIQSDKVIANSDVVIWGTIKQ